MKDYEITKHPKYKDIDIYQTSNTKICNPLKVTGKTIVDAIEDHSQAHGEGRLKDERTSEPKIRY